MNFLKNIFKTAKGHTNLPGGEGWSSRMGWRVVTYIEDRNVLAFQIEPMAIGPDVVYVPDTQAWQEHAPLWVRGRVGDILLRLKSVSWNRELNWSESAEASFLTDDSPVPGSLESTPGGRQLEAQRLFHPDSKVTHAQAHEIWHTVARRFATAARGRVTLVTSAIIPNSVFEAVELPALRANPNVTLDFR